MTVRPRGAAGPGAGGDTALSSSLHPLQGCEHFVPGLRGKPWWSPQAIPEVALLEQHAAEISNEFDDLVLSGRLRLHPRSLGSASDELTDGEWNMFELWSYGLPHRANLLEAPITAEVLGSMHDAIADNPRGFAYFSVLQPGVHMQAHCGHTNAKLRVHLGLQVSSSATMRVGTETRGWEQGKCIVFDDSWEHEVTNRSDRPRSILLIDIWHPDLSKTQRDAIADAPGRPAESYGERGLTRVRSKAAAAHGAVSPQPLESGVFAAVDTDRLTRIAESAGLARECGLPFLAWAAERVLCALAADSVDEIEADGRLPAFAAADQPFAPLVADGAIWGELAALGDSTSDRHLQGVELIDLAHLAGLCWRTLPGRADAMRTFLEAWSVAEKAALSEELSALGSAAQMVRALGELEGPAGPPPFGALIPMLCAAHHRAGSTAEHNVMHQQS
jgi:Aspartyl/Asparaginyl beta-hydroxylase